MLMACENIASSVYQNSQGSHLIVLKYETPKEISISIQKIDESTNLNLKDSFKKVNYEYILGDYCIFDKTLLSIGIDSNMLYTTVKCGDGANEIWAFMRSILSENGDFYTPSGPLIFFKKGDPSFDQLLFLSVYNGNDYNSSFADSVVLRYNITPVSTKRSEITYFATYLHELNTTQNSIGTQIASFKNISFSSTLIKFNVRETTNGKTKIKFFVHQSSDSFNISTFMDSYIEDTDDEIIFNKSPSFVRVFGFRFNFEAIKITWNIRDIERIRNEDCSMEYEKEEELENCEDKTDNKKLTHVFIALYFIAGAELLLLIATLVALITVVVVTNKKSKNISNNGDEVNVTLLGHTSTKGD
uniref:Uncharacterized protein n=1 Tax=Panagrolaimus superbus TaxID=310955 RepID=A0A914Y1U8_9BILA